MNRQIEKLDKRKAPEDLDVPYLKEICIFIECQIEIMKEITIQFSADELVELAKQLSLARYFSVNGNYDNVEMVDNLMTRICATGMAEAPETKAFRHGGPGEPAFFISLDLDFECEPLIELYKDSVVQEYLPYSLADRDFMEQYNTLDPETIVNNPDMLAALKTIQKKYIDEFEKYGVTHLRLEESK